ncbi:MAG TPA: hypothetical protein DHW64_06495, partial [Chitinophagaceae bacterium]|nr:hypothetical protein [Chitinophagaceae bacterium]
MRGVKVTQNTAKTFFEKKLDGAGYLLLYDGINIKITQKNHTMKKLLFVLMLGASFVACKSGENKEAAADTTAAA